MRNEDRLQTQPRQRVDAQNVSPLLVKVKIGVLVDVKSCCESYDKENPLNMLNNLFATVTILETGSEF